MDKLDWKVKDFKELAQLHLEDLVETNEDFERLRIEAERYGWIEHERTKRGILYVHPLNPSWFQKFVPYSLVQNSEA